MEKKPKPAHPLCFCCANRNLFLHSPAPGVSEVPSVISHLKTLAGTFHGAFPCRTVQWSCCSSHILVWSVKKERGLGALGMCGECLLSSTSGCGFPFCSVLAAGAEPRGEMFFTAYPFITGVPAAAALAPWQLAVALAGAVVHIFPFGSSQRGEKLQQRVREWCADAQLSYAPWAYLLHTLKLKHAAKVHVAVSVFTNLSSCPSSLGS